MNINAFIGKKLNNFNFRHDVLWFKVILLSQWRFSLRQLKIEIRLDLLYISDKISHTVVTCQGDDKNVVKKGVTVLVSMVRR